MTDVLQLVLQYDQQVSPITTLNLLNYADGIDVAEDGWAQALPNGDGPVDEVITLRMRGATSQDDLATVVRALDDLIEQHRLWKEGASRYGLWLRVKGDSETNTRQALILDIMRSNKSSMAQDPFFRAEFTLTEYSLVIERMPWEATSATALSQASNVNLLGGRVVYSGVVGDVPARIPSISFLMETVYNPQIRLAEVWAGVRGTNWGTVANFQPIWELDRGSLDIDSSVLDPYSGQDAYNDIAVECDFSSTADMEERIRLWLGPAFDGADADMDDNRGTFLVLLRARATGDAVCHVKLGTGYAESAVFPLQQRVRISDTSWGLYPLGLMSIPSTSLPETEVASDPGGTLYTSGLVIHASRYSGSGNLQFDIVGLIPVDLGLLHMSSDRGAITTQDRMVTIVAPDGRVTGYISLAAALNPELSGRWGLHPVSGALIVFGQRKIGSGGSVLTDEVTIDVSYIPHYSTFRGNT